MKIDTVKAIGTYATAYTIVVGGFALIYFTRLDASAATMQVLMGGFIGAAITFLFNSEVSTRATYAATAATAAGVASTPTTTVSAGPPATVTTAPSESGVGTPEQFGD